MRKTALETALQLWPTSALFRNDIAEQFRINIERIETGRDTKDQAILNECKILHIYSKTKLKEWIVKKSGASESTLRRFQHGDPKIRADMISALLNVFDEVITSEKIVGPVLDKHMLRSHPDIEEDRLDKAVHALIDGDKYRDDIEVCGPIAEIRVFGRLDPIGRNYSTIGIEPDEISIEHTMSRFKDDARVLDERLRRELIDKKVLNQEKMSLVGIAPEFHMIDAGGRATLFLESTDYVTIRASLSLLANEEDAEGNPISDRSEARAVHGSVDPRQNGVPNSLCLHYIVRTADGKYLAIRRHSGVAYDRLKVSLTGEEQIKRSDLDPSPDHSACALWIYRTLMEEIFPARDYAVDSQQGRLVREVISFTRVLSIIYEERFCNFALVAFIQLETTLDDYIEIYRGGLRAAGRADFEGNRYWFDRSHVRAFFATGRFELHPVRKGGKKIQVVSGKSRSDPASNMFRLHSSSLYRMHLIRNIEA